MATAAVTVPSYLKDRVDKGGPLPHPEIVDEGHEEEEEGEEDQGGNATVLVAVLEFVLGPGMSQVMFDEMMAFMM